MTHRTTELERADLIVVLGEQGCILQQGRHQELVAAEGEYRTLYHRYHAVEDLAEAV